MPIEQTNSSTKQQAGPLEEIEQRLAQQALVSEFGRFALGNHDFDAILENACRTAAQGLGAPLAKVLEYLSCEDTMLLRAGIGWRSGLVGMARVGADLESPAGYAFKTHEPVISNHLAEEKRFRTPWLMAEHGVKRAVNVIIQGGSEPFGVLEVDSRDPGAFSAHDINFLQALANTLGVAIDRERSQLEVERLNKALTEREIELSRAIELNPQIPWTADAAGRLVGIDKRWLRLSGLTRTGALGEGWQQVLHPDEQPAVSAAWKQAVGSGGIYDIEHRIRGTDGQYRWMRSRAAPWRDPMSGRIMMWYGSIEDIHDRRIAEIELARSEARLRRAAEAAGFGTYDIDLVSGTQTWSSELYAIFGQNPAEAPGIDAQGVPAGVHPDDRAGVAAAVAASLARESSGEFGAEYRIIRPDTSERWVMVRGRVEFSGGERRPVRSSGTVVDVTALKGVEAALRAALAQKDLLAREVEHRVKNSLTMINSLLRMQGRKVTDDAARWALSEAADRVMTVAKVHDRLHLSADLSRVDFADYLKGLCHDLADSQADRSEALKVMVQPVSLPVDRAIPLGLIIAELITNAFKYGRKENGDASIEVRLECRENIIHLTVQDQGPGLPAGFKLGSGGGLGTRVIEALAHQIDATVTARSANGGGARFSLAVPAAESTRRVA